MEIHVEETHTHFIAGIQCKERLTNKHGYTYRCSSHMESPDCRCDRSNESIEMMSKPGRLALNCVSCLCIGSSSLVYTCVYVRGYVMQTKKNKESHQIYVQVGEKLEIMHCFLDVFAYVCTLCHACGQSRANTHKMHSCRKVWYVYAHVSMRAGKKYSKIG